VIVISGGTNDMDNNCDKGSEVLIKMTKFMQSYSNTNIVIMSVPPAFIMKALRKCQINAVCPTLLNPTFL